MKKIAFAGAGFASAVIARELAKTNDFHLTVFDERNHLAGNCHTERDGSTGVLLHRYGPHIFNTSRQDVWDYITQWSPFGPFTNRVKAITDRGVFSLPINLLTINQFFKRAMNPKEAAEFVANLGDKSIDEPANFEEQGLKLLGRELYECFFSGYTKKQWGVDPKELPASILKRLPIRFNYDDNYYNQKFQGIPIDGYSKIVERILAHPSIEVKLNQRFEPLMAKDFDHVFWSGPLDGFFDNELGRLRYRTLHFERFEETGDFQGNPVINYCQENIPYTRITEHKHFAPWESHERTVCFREYSAECADSDTPYYPLRLNDDKTLLQRYVNRAKELKHTTFIGRLGTYRYLDMHVVIGESLDLARTCLSSPMNEWPVFSQEPL